MNFEEFKAFVEENSGWFYSDLRETVEDIRYFEDEIGFGLPEELKWLLSEFGYSESCGVESLSSSVAQTLELRESEDLPENVFILTNWNDDRIVLLLAGRSEVVSCETEDVYSYAETGAFTKAVDIFENYPAWLAHRLEQENEEF